MGVWDQCRLLQLGIPPIHAINCLLISALTYESADTVQQSITRENKCVVTLKERVC